MASCARPRGAGASTRTSRSQASGAGFTTSLYNRAHDASTARVVSVAALRAAGDVHAAAARRGSARPRRRDCRRAVRRRHVVSAGREARPARDPGAVVADSSVQLLPEGRAVRSPERGGRRRHRRAAGQHREVLRRRVRADWRDRGRRRQADRDWRRPLDLAADSARAREASRSARAGAVRRPHRHVGRVLRRQVLSRHAVPPRHRRRVDRRQAVHPGRHPRADVRRRRFRLSSPARHHDDRHRPGEGAAASRGRSNRSGASSPVRPT